MADERFQRFFALAVEPKKLYTQSPQYNLHITQVILDPDAQSKDRSVLIAQVDGQGVPIASLRLGGTEQVLMDVLFDEGVELSFSVRGSNTVHVIGYFVNDMEEVDEDDDEEDLDEDDFQDAVLSKRARRDLEAADIEAAASEDDEDDEDFDSAEADEDDDEDDAEDDDEPAQQPAITKPTSADAKKRVRLPDESDKATAKATPAKKTKADNAPGAAAKPGAAPKTAAVASTPTTKPAGSPATPSTVTAATAELSKSERKKKKNLEKAAKKEQQAAALAAAQSPAKAAPGATPKKADAPVKRTLPSGLQIEELQLGHGKVAEPGKMVGVKYVGRLMSGRMFDESKNKPFTFRLATGQVIKGWDDGLKGMRLGGKRRLIIPPALAYGKRGAPPDIPPNSTLQFEVELVSC